MGKIFLKNIIYMNNPHPQYLESDICLKIGLPNRNSGKAFSVRASEETPNKRKKSPSIDGRQQ